MISVKDSLRSALDRLNEDEARQTLEYIQRFRMKQRVSPTLARLASDPTFKIPVRGTWAFRPVEPVRSRGIAASDLLIQDRR